MTFDKQRVRHLMRTDLITLGSGKSSSKSVMIWSTVAFMALGIFISPLMGLYCPLLAGGMLSLTLLQTESKYHSEKMFAMLPIARHELVISRFVLTTAINVVLSALFYFIMLIAVKLKLYDTIGGMTDILGLLAQRTSFTETGLFNLCFFGIFSFSLLMNAATLRKGFREDSAVFNTDVTLYTKNKKALKRDLTYVAVISGVLAFLFLALNGIIPVGPALAVIAGIFSQLAQAADGFILGAVMLITGIMYTGYSFVCSVCEYDEKELKG